MPVGSPTICHPIQDSQSHLSCSVRYPRCANTVRQILRDLLLFGIVSSSTCSYCLTQGLALVTGVHCRLHVSEISLFHWQHFCSVMPRDGLSFSQGDCMVVCQGINQTSATRGLFFTYSQATVFSIRYFSIWICCCPLN